jgi:hypothetical protein
MVNSMDLYSGTTPSTWKYSDLPHIEGATELQDMVAKAKQDIVAKAKDN